MLAAKSFSYLAKAPPAACTLATDGLMPIRPNTEAAPVVVSGAGAGAGTGAGAGAAVVRASTSTVALSAPTPLVARMRALPPATAVTSPLAVTVATAGLDDDHVIARGLRPDVASEALSCTVSPTSSVSAVALLARPSAADTPSRTVARAGSVARGESAEQAAARMRAANATRRGRAPEWRRPRAVRVSMRQCGDDARRRLPCGATGRASEREVGGARGVGVVRGRAGSRV
jgi:hypothetical protein